MQTSTSYPISRRDFLRLVAFGTAAATVPSVLAACTPSAYSGKVEEIWNQPFSEKETSMQPYHKLIEYATLAPSGHNTQPWKFSIREHTIRITPDFERRLTVVDSHERELFISLGCALENLLIAAAQHGYECETESFTEDEPDCIRVTLKSRAAQAHTGLFDAIRERQCTRSEYNGQPIPAVDLQHLQDSVAGMAASVRVYTHAEQGNTLIELVRNGNLRQFGDKAFVEELITWIRFNEQEALKTLDGLFSLCSGNPSVPRWLGRLFLTLSGADALANADEKKMRTSPAFALIITQNDDKRAWVEAGRAYERFALTATALGIKNAFLNQPVEVAELRQQMQERLTLGEAYPQLFVRLGYAAAMPRSLRRPLEQILT